MGGKFILRCFSSFFSVWLGITVFVLPYIFSPFTIDPVLTLRFFLLAILLFCLTLYFLNKVSDFSEICRALAKQSIFPVLLFFFLFSTLSLFKATNISEGIFELLKISLWIVFLFFSTILLAKNKKGVTHLTKAVIFGALLHSIIGLAQVYYTSLNAHPGNFAIQSTMANKNLFASALFLTLPFLFYGFITFSGPWRLLSIFSFGLAVYTINLTQTRAVWFAMIISTGVLGILCFFYSTRHFNRQIKPVYFARVIYGIILIIVVSLVAIVSNDSSLEETLFRPNEPISSIEERLKLWTKTLNMISENPLLGVGIGNWKIIIPSYGTTGLRSEQGEVHFQRPHNDFLWILAETGIISLLFYTGFFVIIAIYAKATLADLSASDEVKIFSLLTIFCLIGYLVVAFFSYPKERIAHSIYLSLVLASFLSCHHTLVAKKIRRPLSKGYSYFTLSSVLILTMVSIVVGYERMNAEIHTKKALAARDQNNWPVVIKEIESAESVFSNIDPMSTPLSWYKGLALFSQNDTKGALVHFARAHLIHPYHIHVLNNIGTCYEVLGNHDKALNFYKKALFISPNFEEALINMSVVYYNMGDYKKALAALEQCPKDSSNPKLPEYLEIVNKKLNALRYEEK